jgi:uncharacterized protein
VSVEVEFSVAIAQFNQSEFYACHDTLEAIWMDAEYPDKTFYQGVLQIAVGLYHLSNNNWRGAVILLGEGIGRLRDFQPNYVEVDVEQLVLDSATLLKTLQINGEDGVKAIAQQMRERSPELVIPKIHLVTT